MLIKLGIFFSLIFGYVSFVFADIPTFPSDCFLGKNFCSRAQVIHGQQNRRVIRVEIFVQMFKAEYSKFEELKDLYFQFEDWPSYAGHSDSISFIESASKVGPAPLAAIRHQAHYTTKAPWPVSKAEVFDLLEYQEIAKAQGVVYAVEFSQVQDFSARKGVKYNYGQLHLLDDQHDRWLVYFYSDVIPGIDVLPNVAAPFILKPMEDILRGMFKQ